MDIRVLRYYLAVCREGNMSRAATALHVTQPTLSRQIAELERELGCTLLVRGSRSVTPTEKGHYLRRRAEEIVTLADQTTDDLMRDDTTIEGDVRIGAGESEGMRIVAEQVHRFRQAHPHVCFHIRSGNSIDVIDWLERGLIDFAVLVSYPDINRFAHVRLARTDVWGVLMPEDSALTRKQALEPGDLTGVPLILSEQALETGELPQWFGAAKDHLDIAATYNLVFNAVQLVREHVGLALALEGLVTAEPDSGLEFRLLHPPLVSPIDFAWKRELPLSAAARAFLGALQEDC